MSKLKSKTILDFIFATHEFNKAREEFIKLYDPMSLSEEQKYKKKFSSKWRRGFKGRHDECTTISAGDYLDVLGVIVTNSKTDERMPSFEWGNVTVTRAETALKDWIDSGRASNKKPWCRHFYPPDDELQENFRLEVITSHDDEHIIGWGICVD